MSNLHLKQFQSEKDSKRYNQLLLDKKALLETVQTISEKKQFEGIYAKDLGWLQLDEWANEAKIKAIELLAEKVQQQAEVLVVVGVGGSNQGARALLSAIEHHEKIEIVYLGNNLSERYIQKQLTKLKGKSVCFNIIAKNFATLEPGLAFRLCRKFIQSEYSESDQENRVIVTGTKGDLLEELALKNNYTFLDFPPNIGGRFSVFSNVGLFPVACSGISIRKVLKGAKKMMKHAMTEPYSENIPYHYAVSRNNLLNAGYNLECLAYFEPSLDYFSRWWRQLFAESEGKDGKGLYPVTASFTEDLHSVGQYIQEGQPILFETMIDVVWSPDKLELKDDLIQDDFEYLSEKKLPEINRTAFEATVKAHLEADVPINVIQLPDLAEESLGQLLYLMEFSCYLSSLILGVHPFNQPGVESYKKHMFARLKRN